MKCQVKYNLLVQLHKRLSSKLYQLPTSSFRMLCIVMRPVRLILFSCCQTSLPSSRLGRWSNRAPDISVRRKRNGNELLIFVNWLRGINWKCWLGWHGKEHFSFEFRCSTWSPSWSRRITNENKEKIKFSILVFMNFIQRRSKNNFTIKPPRYQPSCYHSLGSIGKYSTVLFYHPVLVNQARRFYWIFGILVEYVIFKRLYLNNKQIKCFF